ncbi:MAG: hypothetical protein EG828_16285, partial [Deltaproteobacteria bacterium]|nr:hypothetical protein [Deltaproteobacteria bacterium]
MSDDLGLDSSLVQTALDTLAEDGVIKGASGVYRLQKSETVAGQVEKSSGWMIWDCYRSKFLPRLYLNPESTFRFRVNESTEPNPASSVADSASTAFRTPEPYLVRDLLRVAASGNDFEIHELYRGRVRKYPNETARVRFISRMSQAPQELFLNVPVEIRPRLASEPGLFFFEPELTWPLETLDASHSPEMRSILAATCPVEVARVHRIANEVNTSFLVENDADVLIKLGGIEKLKLDAEIAVKEQLGSAALHESFYSDDIIFSAQDAERSRLMMASGIMQQQEVRRSYGVVLQMLAAVLGEMMADLFSARPIQAALEQLEEDLKVCESKETH